MGPDEFSFDCPACGQSISATYADAGTTANCPTCSVVLTVPAPQRAGHPKMPHRENNNSPRWIQQLISAIQGFLTRCLTAKVVLRIMLLLLVASWAFPQGMTVGKTQQRGWFFLFDTSSAMHVDFSRLILLNSIIAAGGGMLAWTVSGDTLGRRVIVRLVSYLIFIAPVIMAICGAVFLVERTNRRADDQAAQAALVARKKAEVQQLEVQQRNWRIETEREAAQRNAREADAVAKQNAKRAALLEVLQKAMPDSASAGDILAAIKDARRLGFSDLEIHGTLNKEAVAYKAASKNGDRVENVEWALARQVLKVPPDNFKKISFFDVETENNYKLLGENRIDTIHGRIRNNLPRDVAEVKLRAAFYNAASEQIDATELFLNRDTFHSGEVKSFSGKAFVQQLPVGWTLRLEIIDAYYVQ